MIHKGIYISIHIDSVIHIQSVIQSRPHLPLPDDRLHSESVVTQTSVE